MYYLLHGIQSQRIEAAGNGEVVNSAYRVNPMQLARDRKVELHLQKYQAKPYPQIPREFSKQRLNEFEVNEGNKPLLDLKFDEFSNQITGDGRENLKVLAVYLIQHDHQKININGYDDGWGSSALRQMIGEARAASVANFLIHRSVNIHQLQFGATYADGSQHDNSSSTDDLDCCSVKIFKIK